MIFFLKRATLNVCFAYTSREEMAHGMREIAEGVQLGLIRERSDTCLVDPIAINHQPFVGCITDSVWSQCRRFYSILSTSLLENFKIIPCPNPPS